MEFVCSKQTLHNPLRGRESADRGVPNLSLLNVAERAGAKQALGVDLDSRNVHYGISY